jgi:hypothetical protein
MIDERIEDGERSLLVRGEAKHVAAEYERRDFNAACAYLSLLLHRAAPRTYGKRALLRPWLPG